MKCTKRAPKALLRVSNNSEGSQTPTCWKASASTYIETMSSPWAETLKTRSAYIASAEHLKKALAPMNVEPIDQGLPIPEKHLT